MSQGSMEEKTELDQKVSWNHSFTISKGRTGYCRQKMAKNWNESIK